MVSFWSSSNDDSPQWSFSSNRADQLVGGVSNAVALYARPVVEYWYGIVYVLSGS